MRSAILAVLCVVSAIRTSGQMQVQNVPVAVTYDYYPQPKTLILHAVNNSGKDIIAYDIAVRNKNPDSTVRVPDRKMIRQDMLRTLVAPTASERTEAERVFPIFAAGATRDINFSTIDWPDVEIAFDVIFYADGTFDEHNEVSFKTMLADRQRSYLAIKKATEIAKSALADPNDHPIATAITELTKAAAEAMAHYPDGPYDTDAHQSSQFQWEMMTLRAIAQQKQDTERERLARYVEDQDKRIASMTPHCHLEIALK